MGGRRWGEILGQNTASEGIGIPNVKHAFKKKAKKTSSELQTVIIIYFDRPIKHDWTVKQGEGFP